jgi:hypothetical protein
MLAKGENGVTMRAKQKTVNAILPGIDYFGFLLFFGWDKPLTSPGTV